MSEYTATYSPEDNKLRLYAMGRLPRDLYERVREAGFKWAPKQEIFVAPMWTPEREDLLLELAGSVGDEDTSLLERQEQRAERFEGYSDRRRDDAEAAHAAVAAIADGIPLGQSILVGHHSERRARRDAEKIENGMRRAVEMWKTAKYWTDRAESAIRHAKYKKRPDVRARRIKGLEALYRKQQRNKAEVEHRLRFWNGKATVKNPATGESEVLAMTEKNKDRIWRIVGASYGISHVSCAPREGSSAEWDRWSAYDVLAPDDRRYSACPSWTVAQVVARANETLPRLVIHYDRWISHYENRLAYEKAMLEAEGASDLLKPAERSRPALLPLCNYRQAVIMCESLYHREPQALSQIEMTSAEYAAINKDYKGTRTVEHSHRVRSCMRHSSLHCVFLTDAKVHEKPAAGSPPAPEPPRIVSAAAPYRPPERTKFDDLKDTLEAGVKVVSAPNLFPTPAPIAKMMVEMALVHDGEDVLEPSAGTGNLAEAIYAVAPEAKLVLVEINRALSNALGDRYPQAESFCQDFLEFAPGPMFARIVMNPPFDHGSDIQHIQHARALLAPGGRLVALCANGPLQQAALIPIASEYIPLPAGSFLPAGTNVNVALVVITK